MRFENIFDMTQKKRGIALFLAAALVVCGGTAFVGCAESETTEKTLSGTVYGDYTEETVHELYGAKLQYIGDHIGVGKILGANISEQDKKTILAGTKYRRFLGKE